MHVQNNSLLRNYGIYIAYHWVTSKLEIEERADWICIIKIYISFKAAWEKHFPMQAGSSKENVIDLIIEKAEREFKDSKVFK